MIAETGVDLYSLMTDMEAQTRRTLLGDFPERWQPLVESQRKKQTDLLSRIQRELAQLDLPNETEAAGVRIFRILAQLLLLLPN